MCGKNIACPPDAICQSLEFALLAAGIPGGLMPGRRLSRCAGGNPWFADERVPTVTGSATGFDAKPRNGVPMQRAG